MKIGSYMKLKRLIRTLKDNGIMNEQGIKKEYLNRVASCLPLKNHKHIFTNYSKNHNLGYDTEWRKKTIIKISHFSGEMIKTRGDPLTIKDSFFCFSFEKCKREALLKKMSESEMPLNYRVEKAKQIQQHDNVRFTAETSNETLEALQDDIQKTQLWLKNQRRLKQSITDSQRQKIKEKYFPKRRRHDLPIL